MVSQTYITMHDFAYTYTYIVYAITIGSDIKSILEKHIQPTTPVYISFDLDALEPVSLFLIMIFVFMVNTLGLFACNRVRPLVYRTWKVEDYLCAKLLMPFIISQVCLRKSVVVALMIAYILCTLGRIIGADIVEYNPVNDINKMTAAVCSKLLKEIGAKMLLSNNITSLPPGVEI